jgi:hypothetical protein
LKEKAREPRECLKEVERFLVQDCHNSILFEQKKVLRKLYTESILKTSSQYSQKLKRLKYIGVLNCQGCYSLEEQISGYISSEANFELPFQGQISVFHETHKSYFDSCHKKLNFQQLLQFTININSGSFNYLLLSILKTNSHPTLNIQIEKHNF